MRPYIGSSLDLSFNDSLSYSLFEISATEALQNLNISPCGTSTLVMVDSLDRRRVLQTVGGALTVGGATDVVGGRDTSPQNNLKREKFIYRLHPGGKPHPDSCTDFTNDFNLFGEGVRWPSGKVGYSLKTSSARSASVSPSTFRSAGDAAFAAWNQYAGDISLTSGGDDIRVSFGSFDGKGGVVAVAITTWDSATGEIKQSTITLDRVEPWKQYSDGPNGTCPTPPDRNALDLQNVLTHEIGHSLGLGHVTDNEDGLLTMYHFTTFGETYRRSPDGGDIDGVRQLYGN